MKALVFVVACSTCLGQHCSVDSTAKRYAFVLGNGAYSKLLPVATAVQEARSMAKALESAGFNVTVAENAKVPDVQVGPWREFLAKIRPGDVVFFYYSGYIVQGDDGLGYILPVNYDPGQVLAESGLLLERFLQDIALRKSGLKILMVEGPRQVSTPLKGTGGIGLNGPDLRDSGDVLFAMAARRGESIAALPAPQTSFFTQAVVEQLGQPGLRPSEVFDRARGRVTNLTKGGQIPFIDSAIVSPEFCFLPEITRIERPPEPVPAPIVVVDTVPTNTRDREEYVYIKPGRFKMGCVPSDKKCAKDEGPQHEVAITRGFWMGRTEVSVGAYDRFVRSNKGMKMPGSPNYNRGWRIPSLPIAVVAWNQAESFCQWAGGRLPTEAEWEYAARAGVENEIYPLNDQNSRDKANFFGTKGNDSFETAAPVRSFDANRFNLFDMAGNVWEWVQDFYSPTYYQESSPVDPRGPAMGRDHVIRGGSFESDWQDHLRLSVRKAQGGPAYNIGFRCVLEENDGSKKLLNLQ